MLSTRLMSRLIAFALASTVLSACGDNGEAPPSGVEAPKVASEAPAPAAIPAGAELNDALSPENVNVTLSQDGEPTYLEAEDVMLINIKVANNGQADLVGAGTKPVNLGVLLVGPNGPDTAPGNREFLRVPLPLIAKGTQQTIQAKLPAASLQGQKIQFQLVQEGVTWFDGFGQAPLDLGAYSRCDNDAKGLCDSTGAPVTKQ